MEDLSTGMIADIVIIAGIIAAYGKAFGAEHEWFAEVVIKSFGLRSRYKPAANVLTSVTVSLLIGTVLALHADNWFIVPLAGIAGLYTSRKAAEVHDTKKAAEGSAEPEQPVALAAPRRFQ